jgi:hypothetical protein
LPSILDVTPEQILSLQIIGAICSGTRRKADAFVQRTKSEYSILANVAIRSCRVTIQE